MYEIDILFLNLHRKYLNQNQYFGGFIGIFLLASFMEQYGYESKALEGSLVEGKELVDKLCKENELGMVGLYCDYDNVTENIYLSRYIKDTYNIPVIIGGPQATSLGIDFYQQSKCDAVVRYEGELTVLELVNCLLDDTVELEQIKGISYLKDNSIIKNPERPPIKNLDSIAFPKKSSYIHPHKYHRTLTIISGRGCPFQCTFCHEGSHTKSVRTRSIENVMEEIDYYIANIPKKNLYYITLADDTFTLNSKRVQHFCEEIKKRSKDKEIYWFCEGHVHTLYKHPEMIDYLADAQCYRLQLGIESGTQKVLDAYKKHSTVEEIFHVVKYCHQAGIKELYGNIILGAAFFDREIYENELQFAKDLLEASGGTLDLGVVVYWPLAETTLTNFPEKYGMKIMDKNFYTSLNDFPQTECGELTRLDIMKMQQEFRLALEKHMQELIIKGKIPEKTIRYWSTFQFLGANMWKDALAKLPHIKNYYELIYSGEATDGKEYSEEDWFQLHPMRVVGINQYMNLQENTEPVICDIPITSELMMDVFLYSTGKLSISDIISQLKNLPAYINLNDKTLINDVKANLYYLNEKKLLVYSKY